jgi:hypothetical protein
MLDSSGIGASGGGFEWWDVPVGMPPAPSGGLCPDNDLPPAVRRRSVAGRDADVVAILRTPGFDPGVESIAMLAGLDVGPLRLADRIDAVAEWARATAWLEAVGQQLLASVAAADATPDQWAREEVAAVLGLAPVTAAGSLARAVALTSRLPGTLDALAAGQISALQARAVVDASGQLPDELAGALENAILPRASSQTLSELKRSLRRAVLRLDPASAEQRRKAAHGDRYVRIGIVEDGMAQLWALLPAADAQAIHAQVDATARHIQRVDASDPRTRDQLRADALTAAVLSAAVVSAGERSAGGRSAGPFVRPGVPSTNAQSGSSEQQPSTERGHRPAVHVIVGLTTLLGEDDEPAELEGYGPITAGYAREICHDPTGTWRRLVVDPVGQLIEVGRRTYRPPAAMRNHVVVRNSVCSFPGCNQRAAACDLDHCVPWPHGTTSAGNLHPVCRRHHRAKHEAGWRVQLDPDGTTHWRSPSGRQYISRPPTRWNPDPKDLAGDRPEREDQERGGRKREGQKRGGRKRTDAECDGPKRDDPRRDDPRRDDPQRTDPRRDDPQREGPDP